jgi:predicted CopG family antitoxin
MSNATSRIPLEPQTRDDLRAMKEGVERYDDVIRRLIEENRENG